MKGRRKKIFALVAVFMAVFCVVQLTASIYAWLVNYVWSGDFVFTAGELPSCTLEIARIPYSNTGRAEENRTYYKCTNNKIEANADGTHLAAKLDNMTFGTIDNVAQLKPENIVYLRLTVPKELGDTINVNLHYGIENIITLYQKTVDEDGKESTKQIEDETMLNGLIAVEGEDKANGSFLLFDAAVSNQKYEANKIAEKVKFAEDEAKYLKFTTDAPQVKQVKKLINEDFGSVEENYYIYVKVVPNLRVFGYSIEYISAYMPCYMYFNIGAIFDTANHTPAGEV